MGSGQQFNAQFLAGRSNPIGAATWPPLTRRRGLGRQRRRAITHSVFPPMLLQACDGRSFGADDFGGLGWRGYSGSRRAVICESCPPGRSSHEVGVGWGRNRPIFAFSA